MASQRASPSFVDALVRHDLHVTLSHGHKQQHPGNAHGELHTLLVELGVGEPAGARVAQALPAPAPCADPAGTSNRKREQDGRPRSAAGRYPGTQVAKEQHRRRQDQRQPDRPEAGPTEK